MAKLAATQTQREWEEPPSAASGPASPEADAATAGMVARVRLLMVISGLTTVIAIAAVIGVIGYRLYHAGGSGGTAPAETTVTLPKGARVVASVVAGDHVVVTLDIAGLTEIRTFDVRTLKETGRVRFATEP